MNYIYVSPNVLMTMQC